MDANPSKRRKLDHQDPAAPRDGLSLMSASSAGMYRPSTFILETEELLKEVRVDYGNTFAGADDLLHRIKNAIESIKPHDPIPVQEATARFEKKHHIVVPYPEPRPAKDSQYKVSFAKPSHSNVVGSYVLQTIVRAQKDPAIDMIVEMPKGIFQEKDFLDLRYFYKRAYYLANLAAGILQDLGHDAEPTFEYLNGNTLLPVLSLRRKTADGQGSKGTNGTANGGNAKSSEYRIRVIPCAPEALFPHQKLLPTKICIRNHGSEEKDTPPSTPFYNSTLKAESSFLSYLKLLRKTEKECPSFRDACMLGRVWLQQRGFGGPVSQGGFGHFEWAVLTAMLLQGGGRKGAPPLSSSLSSTQLFKATTQFLSVTDFSKKPAILGASADGTEASRDTGPVLFDAARQLNLAFKMSLWSAVSLHQHAKRTHSLLDKSSVDQFNPTFIARADVPLLTYDLLATVENDGQAQEGSDYRGSAWSFSNRLFSVLRRALGDRAQLVHIQFPGASSWTLGESPKARSSAIQVGVVFDQATMSRQVDHGPSVEEKKEAKRFRQFWGEKAELRRFKDGSILESLIWTKTNAFDLCEEIMRYILKLHLRLDEGHVSFYGKGFLPVVPIKQSDAGAFTAAKQAFQEFERDVRDLEGLPLHVRQLVPAAAELRSASVRPPHLGSTKSPVRPMDTVIFFEASGKWPDNLAAIQRTKVAFLLMIGTLLEDAKPGVITHVGLEDAETEIENLAFLDVVYESGAAFRLRIHSDLEEDLLERRTRDKTLEQHVKTEAAQLLGTLRRLYTHIPRHTQTISTFCTRFPALSPTIRLVKQWFNFHKLLAFHFQEEFVELVTLYNFLVPHPWQAPSSAMTGFLRTLLFLARWDWRADPLIIDSSEDLSAEDQAAIETRLEAWRKIDPNMNRITLFVATPHDASGTAYTTSGGEPTPSKVVATRMTALARSASKLVREKGVELDPRALFQPSLKEYDFQVHLDMKIIKNVLRGDDGTKHSHFKNLDARIGKTPLPVPQHPVRTLLKQLNGLYAGPVVFFHGGEDDSIISGVWNPQIQRRSFRVNLPCSFKPVRSVTKNSDDREEEDDIVEVNRDAMLAEIARIGGDLIEKVEAKMS
ncbi:U3 small nucleolar RNA-associated protein 22 [Pleurostoma richardsiae]|uniref:U3 small nucleolar RNA-associated protein 22 n=1 Tax=Pleurostoma richardsiae TaxID=41990 RepID=A0AA38VUP7_9PEZI|nr:U3 small nucleolar RNA-associated protein 22 [Pleurostoma richardsiae]